MYVRRYLSRSPCTKAQAVAWSTVDGKGARHPIQFQDSIALLRCILCRSQICTCMITCRSSPLSFMADSHSDKSNCSSATILRSLLPTLTLMKLTSITTNNFQHQYIPKLETSDSFVTSPMCPNVPPIMFVVFSFLWSIRRASPKSPKCD